ncbi:MAG: hypothetical protein V3S02_04825, partial [Dehalococcoidales bacterium]
MGFNRKNLEVFTIPEIDLRAHLSAQGEISKIPNWATEIRHAELVNNSTQLTFCFSEPWKEWKQYKGTDPSKS